MEFVKDQSKHRPPWEINTPNNTETLLLWLSFFYISLHLYALKYHTLKGITHLALITTTTDQLEMTKKDFVPIFLQRIV